MEQRFFELLQFAIGARQTFDRKLTDDEWQTVYQMAKEQSLMGVLALALGKLPEEMQPPRRLKLNWIVQGEKIADRNAEVNKVVVKVSGLFAKHGMRCCILKGQGNALMYPKPDVRVAGDVDVWLLVSPKKVIKLARKALPTAKACYHHVDFCKVDGVPIELHYRPSFMNNLIVNSRLQKWFLEKADEQAANRVELPNGVGTVSVPTNGFNRIFQMAHISNHVMHEGIGLRQLLDYYYLLQRCFTAEEKEEDGRLLKRFGLYKMAAAVMYVLNVVFGLPEDKMIVPPDEKRGRFLLNEILLSGNFGQFDERLKNSHSQVSKNMQRLKRDIRFLGYFPSESLWEPVFRWYHFFWRLRHN